MAELKETVVRARPAGTTAESDRPAEALLELLRRSLRHQQNRMEA